MDLYLDWNSDLSLTPSGSIQTAVGWDSVRQRIIRRLITNASQALADGSQTPPDYIFEPDFGVGLGKAVDGSFSQEYLRTLERKIALAVLQDAGVDSTVPPGVKFMQPNPSTLRIVISVVLLSGQPGQISLTVT